MTLIFVICAERFMTGVDVYIRIHCLYRPNLTDLLINIRYHHTLRPEIMWMV